MNETRRGIWLMVLTMLIFAAQDGMSRHLAGEYNVIMVVMIRYWFFAAFVLTVSSKRAGSIRKSASTSQPILQSFRGLLLVAEICVMVLAFTYLGLIESLAIFISYPLMVAALSGPILGEKVGPRRWIAIGIGFIGVMIILQPGMKVFSPYAIIPLTSASMFAVYSLLTRFAARKDTAETSFFWTGTTGAAGITIVGVWFWEPMITSDWFWMALLCISGAAGHFVLIKVYELAEASAVQPFAYLQLVFASVIGITVFGETLRANVVLGTAIVIGAGLFTLWRSRQVNASSPPSDEVG